MLNQILLKYDEKRYLRQFVSEMFDLCSMIQLNLLHNTSVNVLLPWHGNILGSRPSEC